MATIVHSINLIVSTPTVRNGRPIIEGTSITVADGATPKLFWRKDADDIAEQFNLSLSQVYAALAYYYDHKNDIDADIQRQEELAKVYKEQRLGSRHDSLLVY